MQPAPAGEPYSVTHPPKRRIVHFAIASVMTATVLIGFWPSFYGPVLRGASTLSTVFHIHGAIFTGWMALLLTQVALVMTGRTAAHRKVGSIGIWYGVAVLIMGLVVTFASARMHLRTGDMNPDQIAEFLIVPLGDMVLFGGFFSAAILRRGTPETHKRLMLVATQALLFAAFGRMQFLLTILPLPVAFLVWLTPLALAMTYEAITRRRVHRVYVIGFVILLVCTFRALLGGTVLWLSIGRALLRPLV